MTKTMTVGPKGQIVIPAELRKKLGIKPGDKVRLEQEGDDLKIISLRTVVAKLKGKYADLGVALSEELLSERRAEAEAKGW